MKKQIQIGVLGLALALSCPTIALARGGGHGGGWGGGAHFGGGHWGGGYYGGHYGGHYGGWGGHVYPRGGGIYYGPGLLGFGLGLGYGYGWPYYYPYNSYYYGYPSTVIQVPSVPQVYIERGDADTSPAPQAGYWYYCRRPEGYYPYVRECPNGWEQVSPRPQDR